MWTRLAAVALRNCDAWNTLSADLLLVVAKHCDASSVPAKKPVYSAKYVVESFMKSLLLSASAKLPLQ